MTSSLSFPGYIPVKGRFSKCVLLCTCVLVDLRNVISAGPSTVPIQSSHLTEYGQIPRMCTCTAHFTGDASEETCVDLGELCIPECISRKKKKSVLPLSRPPGVRTSNRTPQVQTSEVHKYGLGVLGIEKRPSSCLSCFLL